MKKLFAVILLIMLSASLFACEKENVTDDFVPVDKEITVMSFNIRTLDVLGAGDTGYKSWDARKEDAVALVLRHQPDIIGFQELKNVQYEYLKKNLPGYDCYGKNGWDNGNPDEAIFIELLGGTNAIFYKRNDLSLSTAKPSGFRRRPTCARQAGTPSPPTTEPTAR